ncbi:hypothetical protein EBT16_10165 [bacterium]|nr:hypothetical protein [bacterium]
MNELTAALPSKLTEIPQERIKPKNSLGKDDFLKLLMAQLNNQDPLKPMEHQEFSAQLAQFGSLEQLQNIHKGIESLQGGMGNESKLSGRVTAVEMNGNNPVLVVQTSSGSAKLDLAKVSSVAQDSKETVSVPNAVSVTKEQSVKPLVKEPVISPKLPEPEVASPEAASGENGVEGPELEQQWRGFPPFASFESLRP